MSSTSAMFLLILSLVDILSTPAYAEDRCGRISLRFAKCTSIAIQKVKNAMIQAGQEDGQVDLSPGSPLGPECKPCTVSVVACNTPSPPKLKKLGHHRNIKILINRSCLTDCPLPIAIDVEWGCDATTLI